MGSPRVGTHGRDRAAVPDVMTEAAAGRSVRPPPGRLEAVVVDVRDDGVLADATRARLRRAVRRATRRGVEVAVIAAVPPPRLAEWVAIRPPGPGMLVVAPDGDEPPMRLGARGPVPIRGRPPAGPGPPPAAPDAPLAWIMDWLWSLGVAPGQVSLPLTGAAAAIATLEDQLARRRRGDLPRPVMPGVWALMFDGSSDARVERARESLLTLSDGTVGTRGSGILPLPGDDPQVLMAGVYAGYRSTSHLLAAPRWTQVGTVAAEGIWRTLDLHAGVAYQAASTGSETVQATLLASVRRPGTAVLRARGDSALVASAPPLSAPAGGAEVGETDGYAWMRVRLHPASIVAAARDRRRVSGPEQTLDRVAAYAGGAEPAMAVDAARRAHAQGFDRLLCEQRRAWAARWQDADVRVAGDPALQQALRCALFHLMGAATSRGEAAVGARGLTGDAYRGHVFWDGDVYVLPCLAAIRPAAARAMLEYRLRRLPAALSRARALGRAGARFPWESARTGTDVTPHRGGEGEPILTGRLEEHIVADVAWAAACYVDWTGDRGFAAGRGRHLLVQTARWWASRVEVDDDGSAHIRGVIGPDEYHVDVDDNAFTNVMARWNLRRAARAAGDQIDATERRRWLDLAAALVDGYDPATGVYEQFAGFHALEPLLIGQIAPQRPVAADLLLGPERTAGAQVVKQADALMLHYLIGEETAAGSLAPNLDFYGPRTAHGSTLSPGVHAALLARAGRPRAACEMLDLTARIDLEDIGHVTAGGLHLAAMGSLWRAMTFGFAGLWPQGDALVITPVLPGRWEALEVRLRFRGARVRVRVTGDGVHASADPPVNVIVGPLGERARLTATERLLESEVVKS